MAGSDDSTDDLAAVWEVHTFRLHCIILASILDKES